MLQYSHSDDRCIWPSLYPRQKSSLEKSHITMLHPHFDCILDFIEVVESLSTMIVLHGWENMKVWRSEVGVYGGWLTTDQSMQAIAAVVTKEVGQALSWWSLVSWTFSSGRFRRMASFSLWRFSTYCICHCWSCSLAPKSQSGSRTILKDCGKELFARTLCLEFPWSRRTGTAPFHGLSFRFRVIKVGPRLIACD